MRPMRYRVLGPLEVRTENGWTTVRSPSSRVLLAVLLTRANEVVTKQRLQTELWGERLPPTADKTLQVYISRLRRVLVDPASVRTEPAGYVLRVEYGELDLHHFEQLAELGQRELTDGGYAAAETALADALGLYRGVPLSDARDALTLDSESARLAERRLSVQDLYCDAMFAQHKYRDVLPLLRGETREHPLRESTWIRLLTALSGDGRPSEALEAYAAARNGIAEQLGTDPGPRLRQLYQDLLVAGTVADTGALVDPSVDVGPVRCLPAHPTDFIGRSELAKRVTALLVEQTERGCPVVTLTGQPGVGKTALAIHLAHRLRDRFPGGQLYLNLHGYATAATLTPEQALAQLLHMLGARPEHAAADIQELRIEYRRALASRSGILLILDNVAEAGQVRPLLPVDASNAVILTSRSDLRGLTALEGARPFTVDTFAPEDSLALLRDILGPDTVDGEADAATELAELCGHLPLALRIAAANVLSRRGTRLREYVSELRGADRLTKLAVEGDEDAAVQRAFDLSYGGLLPEHQRLFRLLGLVPGPDFTPFAAAALLDVSPEVAERSLDHLSAVSLLQRHGANRYEFHDLLRDYAARRAVDHSGVDGEEPAALRRLFEYYLRTIDAAANAFHEGFVLVRMDRPVNKALFSDPEAAQAWLDTELPNLLAAVHYTAEHGPHELSWNLVDSLRPYFWGKLLAPEWLSAAESGVRACASTVAPRVHASMLMNLGAARAHVGDFEHAIVSLRQSVDAHHEAEAYEGAIAVRGLLGRCLLRSGQADDAVEIHHEAIRVCYQTEQSTFWAVRCRLNLAHSYSFVDLRRANEHAHDACTLLQRHTFPQLWDTSMATLARIAEGVGDFGDALNYDRAAVALFRQRKKQHEELEQLISVARVHCLRGEDHQASEVVHMAWPRSRGAGSWLHQVNVLLVLGEIHRLRRDETGTQHYQEALRIAERTRYTYGTLNACLGLCRLCSDSGDQPNALRHGQRALSLSRETQHRVLEGHALTLLSEVHHRAGRYRDATEHAQLALAAHQATGARTGEATARALLNTLACPSPVNPVRSWTEAR